MEDRLVQAAVAAGVPTAPIRAKLREGRAKGVPDGRIEPVVMALVERLRAARARCAGWSAADACTLAVADAELTGLGARQVDPILGESTVAESGRLDAVFALGDLVARGVEHEVAAVLVQALLEKDELREVRDLPRRVADRAARSGESPTDAARGVLDALGNPGKGWGRGHLENRGQGKAKGRTDPKPPAGRGNPGERGQNKGKK